jgi:hypothetical protein
MMKVMSEADMMIESKKRRDEHRAAAVFGANPLTYNQLITLHITLADYLAELPVA